MTKQEPNDMSYLGRLRITLQRSHRRSPYL